MSLADQVCEPCRGGISPLKGDDTQDFLSQLDGWQVIEDHHLKKGYAFPNFKEALAFTNKIGELAETVGHHPDIYLAWGKVEITIWTHKIDGLAEADFIFAAKCDTLI